MSKTASTQPPPFAWVISVILWVQAAGMAIFGISIITTIGKTELPIPAQIFEIFLFALGALWLIMTGLGVLRGKAWSRSSVIVTQLFVVILGFYVWADSVPLALAHIVSGAVALLALFSTPVSLHIETRD